MFDEIRRIACGLAVVVTVVVAVEVRPPLGSALSGRTPAPAGAEAIRFAEFPAVACEAGNKPDPRYVYRDADSKSNNGHWTNFMPAEAADMLKLTLAHKTDPHSGETCIRVDVKWQAPNWCGVAVSSQPDYWGEKEKKAAFDLRGAKKLVFHARGAAGGEHIQVKCAITGDKPFGDSAKAPAESEVVKLGKGWKKYEVDLSKTDLTRVVTPFCFVCSKDYNAGDITFFLDDIYFEF